MDIEIVKIIVIGVVFLGTLIVMYKLWSSL
jgi:hypothetical protein